ncbi:MAG: DUF1178 family protein [Pseudomonadota bacterium]
MIRYDLKCDKDHGFDSWFASVDAFDALQKAGHLTCPECGSTKITKALMAPKVRASRKTASLARAETEKEKALAKLRDEVEKNSDYVGMNFATEARAMHDGDTPSRPIYGEAKIDDAKSLIEDGVPVAPLPFRPKAKTN